MQDIKKIYRNEYQGENVNTVALYINGKWAYEKEFVPNVQPEPKFKQAIVIGNGISRLDFDLPLFLPHRKKTAWNEYTDWQLAKTVKKHNTYGCNALYRDYRVDYLVVTGEELINEVGSSVYPDNNVCYANKLDIMKYPGKYNLIPQDPQWNSGALAAYIAAFDGNRKIFMLGFDGIDNSTNNYNCYAGTAGYYPKDGRVNENYWVQSLAKVMNTYNDTEFVRVAPTTSFRTPELWKYCLNFRTVNFRQFVLEADL